MESTSPRKQAPITSDFILPEKQEIFANKLVGENDEMALQENAIVQQYRRTFWDQGHVIQRQGDSDPFPFLHVKDWYDSFVRKDVLEIGPGDGRQMFILATMANTYSIADISEAVVKKHKDKVAQSFFIKTWNDDFDTSFDTICLWYVFHHVLNNELETFVSFLSRHLKDGGSLVFNVPTIGQEKPDATNTTPYDVLKFKDQMLQLGFDTKDESDQQYNNYVFNMVKAQLLEVEEL